MARSHWLKAAALLGCLFVAVPGCKKETASVPPGASTPVDTSSPKATAKSLGAALNKGDLAAVKTMVTGTDAQMKMIDSMVPAFAAMKKLQDAANAKYGKDNVVSKEFGSMPDPAAEAESADEKIDGDHAVLTPKSTDPAKPAKPMKLVKKDGKWLMELDTIDAPPPEAAASMAPMTKAANEVADEINAGKYPKADDALASLNKKMAEGMGAHIPPTSLPAIPH